MNLAIATDFNGEKNTVESIREMLCHISESGFSHIHWCYEWDGDYMYSIWEMEQICEWMTQYGLKAKGLHASKGSFRPDCSVMSTDYRRDYTSTVEFNRKAGTELIKNRVELANKLGAGEIVLHMYLPYKTFERCPESKAKFYHAVYRSLDELQEFCLEKQVKICVENLYEAPGAMQCEQFDRLFERYSGDFLGLCLDSGHGHMVFGDMLPALAKRYSDRIFAVHLHDNFGSQDEHLIPGQGNISWKALMDVIGHCAYRMPLTLEVVNRSGDPVDVFLKKAFEGGKMLAQYMEP